MSISTSTFGNVAQISTRGEISRAIVPRSLLQRWFAVHRQRRDLASLIDQPHLLDDIGVTQAAARRESGKPFWQR